MKSIEDRIWANASKAQVVPYRPVMLDDGCLPRPNCCHDNVKAWVRLHPADRRVCGWVILTEGMLAAHSVVADKAGVLFDITPIDVDQSRQRLRFFAHPGDDTSFDAFAVNHATLIRLA